MTGRLEGKAALITGAASGIGRATAEAMAAEGAQVALTDVNLEGAEEAAGWINAAGGGAVALAQDSTDEARWQAVIAEVTEKLGGFDILVNNAGTLPEMKRLEATSLESFRRVIEVNLDGVFLGMKHAIRAMRERGGAIVNLGSVYAETGAVLIGGYGASKGAVVALTKSAAIECAEYGDPIRINAVCPGFVDTGMTDEVSETVGRDVRGAMIEKVPMGRMGQPEDVARAIVYLASDDAAYVTGTALFVDGGFVAH